MLSWSYFLICLQKAASGIGLTLQLTFLSVAIGILLGLVIAIIRISRIRVLYYIARVFVSFARSVPLIVILYVLTYSMPQIVSGVTGIDAVYVQISPYVISVAAFSLFAGACLSEAFRSAYYAVEKGQTEAAYSVGLSHAQTLFRIVIPQAIRSCIPNFTNTFIDVLKGTSIVYNVSLFEIMGQAHLAGSKSYRYIEAYLAAILIYLILCFLAYLILKTLETYLNKKY